VIRPPVRLWSYISVYVVLASFLILAHGPLLTLPFYWDEIGQFIPASLDLFRTGSWIPHSTTPNVHPPGVMLWLAAFWSVFGYSIEATRIAMLLTAALGAVAVFLLAIELGRGSAGTPAFTALVLFCISPLFFAQSMLAQLDMPAMSFSAIALVLFLQRRIRASALACLPLVLTKETGIIVPALFAGLLLYEHRGKAEMREALWFSIPLLALLSWLWVLHYKTGSWFGNQAFVAYNLRYPLDPMRFLLALARRLYYIFIGSGHVIGTLAVCRAVGRMPLFSERAWRIAGLFVAAHVLLFSLIGGAVLERYLLPALPVVYIAFAISFQALHRRTRRLATAALMACLAVSNFMNPVYSFPFENNLAFVSFVQLERDAAEAIEPRRGLVATAFPVADALRNPDFGFVNTARQVAAIGDFSPPEIEKLKRISPDLVVVYDRAWDPLDLLTRPSIRTFLTARYGYLPQMTADEIAAALSMRRVGHWQRRGLRMDLLERETARRE
jgi:4-amino-4-deoxy-L-arabinose transferase-like glycosyltransferase